MNGATLALADQIGAAINHVSHVWSANEHVVEDDKIGSAILAAMRGNAQATYDRDDDSPLARADHVPIARLVFAKTEVMPVSLLDEMIGRASQMKIHAPCDRCLEPVRPVARLWVPLGASILQIECCARCKGELDAAFVHPGIVWL